MYFEKDVRHARSFVYDIQKKIRHLPAFPAGADDWFDRHKAAVLAGGAGLLVLGPVGAIAGIVGGEVLNDKGYRETGKP